MANHVYSLFSKELDIFMDDILKIQGRLEEIVLKLEKLNNSDGRCTKFFRPA